LQRAAAAAIAIRLHNFFQGEQSAQLRLTKKPDASP